jgi:hypothetical protein
MADALTRGVRTWNRKLNACASSHALAMMEIRVCRHVAAFLSWRSACVLSWIERRPQEPKAAGSNLAVAPHLAPFEFFLMNNLLAQIAERAGRLLVSVSERFGFRAVVANWGEIGGTSKTWVGFF